MVVNEFILPRSLFLASILLCCDAHVPYDTTACPRSTISAVLHVVASSQRINTPNPRQPAMRLVLPIRMSKTPDSREWILLHWNVEVTVIWALDIVSLPQCSPAALAVGPHTEAISVGARYSVMCQ